MIAVLYLANPSNPRVRAAMARGAIGAMMSPAQGNRLPDGSMWAADNGVFGGKFPGVDAWLGWLARVIDMAPDARARCLFATAPDVLHKLADGSVRGDAAATLVRSGPVLPRIRALGVPAALVGQDGLEHLPVPWSTFDVLFLGGSTEWKLSPAAASLAKQARDQGLRVHMGRLSSRRRWSYAEHIGCHTVDGTFISFGPDRRLPEVLGWAAQPALFTEETA